ncbi:MAG TPA: FtsH protease activity modulator HflK [Phycisphaerae bacterium]|nr:FtsH protease activity modulator HflK [Phycisphaerae bacterium]
MGDRPQNPFRRVLAPLCSPQGLLILAIVAAIAWLCSGFYTVAPNERAVVTRFGEFHAKKGRPGMHYALPWPIDRVYTPEVTDVQRIEVGFTSRGRKFAEPRRSDTLTGDENILKIMMVVQYKTRDVQRYLFNAEDPHWFVEQAVEAAMNMQVASLPVDDVLTTAKNEIQINTIRMAQRWLDQYDTGLVLLGGNLQKVSPPVPVLDAFTEVTDAKKDAERTIDQAREYEGRVIPQARGQAQEIISRAQGSYADRVNRAQGEAARFLSVLQEYRQARQITRTRLYVEAMERILSRTKVIVLDPQEGRPASKITIVDD